MRKITVTRELYTFDELSDKAKEKAREWWRQCENEFGSDSHEFVYEDAERIGKILGIEIDQRPVKTLGGTTLYKPTIYYSGFWSQGDGACFEGCYSYAKGCRKAIREYAPEDNTLHQIADDLFEIQRKNFYRLEARTKHRGHYYHSGCMVVDVTDAQSGYEVGGNAEDGIICALRGFADWIYSQLEKDYEWRNADAQIDENIRCNEYEFTMEGGIA